MQRLMALYKRAYADTSQLHYAYRSAALSFYAVSTVVPMAIVLVSLASLFHVKLGQVIATLLQLFPQVPISLDEIMGITSSLLERQRGFYGLFSFAVAYYFSTQLFLSLHRTLKLMMGIKTPKHHLRRIKLYALPVFLLAILFASTLSVFVGPVLLWVTDLSVIQLLFPTFMIKLINISNWVIFFTFTLFLYLMYHYLVPRPEKRMRHTVLVTLLTAVLFTAMRHAFYLFLQTMAGINPIYGAFSGVIGALGWIYASFMVVLLSARVLHYLEVCPETCVPTSHC